LQNFDCNFANLVAPPTDGSEKCLARYKVHLARNRFRKQCPNRCIIGDAILPQTRTKLTENAVLNLAFCCGAIWRNRKNRNTGAQLQCILYTTAQNIFWKINFL